MRAQHQYFLQFGHLAMQLAECLAYASHCAGETGNLPLTGNLRLRINARYAPLDHGLPMDLDRTMGSYPLLFAIGFAWITSSSSILPSLYDCRPRPSAPIVCSEDQITSKWLIAIASWLYGKGPTRLRLLTTPT